MPQQIFNIWHPLFDDSILIRTSREQLQALADELRGINVHKDWSYFFASQLDQVLKQSLDDDSNEQGGEVKP